MVEQGDTQGFLHLCDPSGDGGDVDAQFLGGRRPIAGLAEGLDDAQVVPGQLADRRPHIPARCSLIRLAWRSRFC